MSKGMPFAAIRTEAAMKARTATSRMPVATLVSCGRSSAMVAIPAAMTATKSARIATQPPNLLPCGDMWKAKIAIATRSATLLATANPGLRRALVSGMNYLTTEQGKANRLGRSGASFVRGLQPSRLVSLRLVACIDELCGIIHDVCHRSKSLQFLRKVLSHARVANRNVDDYAIEHAIGDRLGVAETKLGETTDNQGHRDLLETRTPPFDPHDTAQGIPA
ncbi:MAG: hypothetical protein JNK15_16995 [Planctomycetes bacterium]|nr:hypothetical protein [Planctomycetota bacterium]